MSPEHAYDDLTARERQVHALMAEGLSNAGIARQLYVEEKTIEKHVGAILWKLGLFSGADLGINRRVVAVLKYLEVERLAA